jgi:hypothetical protein
MSDFEQDILNALESNSHFDPAREQVLRLQITAEFQRRKRKLVIQWLIWHVPVLLVLLLGLDLTFAVNQRSPLATHDARLADPVFVAATIVSETRAVTQGAALLVIATAGLISIRLWYWAVRSRLEILREIKRVELRLVHDSSPRAGTATPPA